MSTNARFEGIVHADLEAVWASFRGFGRSTLDYWTILKNVTLKGTEDVLGVERVLTSSRNAITERLESRDDEKHVMTYSLVGIDPNPGLNSYLTTATLTETSAGTTRIVIECSAECSNILVASGFRNRLETVSYPAIVKGLNLLHNPVVAFLTIRDVTGFKIPKMDKFSESDPYVRFSIMDEKGSVMETKSTCCLNNDPNPIWFDEINFCVGKNFDRLRVEVYDADFMDDDDFIFGGELIVGEIKAKLEEKEKEKKEGKEKEKAEEKKEKKNSMEPGLFAILEKGDAKGARVEFNVEFLLSEGVAFNNINSIALLEKQQNALRMMSTLEETKQAILAMLLRFAAEPHHVIGFDRLKLGSHDLPEIPGLCQILPIDRMPKPKLFAGLLRRMMEVVYSLSGSNQRMENEWTALFNPDYVPIPHTVEMLSLCWKDDAEFCRQFFQGINPLQVKVVESVEEIPKEMRSLKTLDDSTPIKELVAAKKLLIADFHLLADIPGRNMEEGGFYKNPTRPEILYYAPIALFYRCEEVFSTGHNLRVLGIQLTRFEDKENQVFTPNSNSAKWLYAKMIVQNADAQMMQFVNHMGIAHFCLEPIAIAFHNWKFGLDSETYQNSTVLKMLGPHLDNVLGINWLGKKLLIGERISVSDRLGPGTIGGVQMLNEAMKSLDYDDFVFPRSLAKRGFGTSAEDDGFKGYYYREDGWLLWRTLKKYASTAVDATFEEDGDVANDKNWKKFVDDVADPKLGNLKFFRTKEPNVSGDKWEGMKIESKESLTELLTAIMYQASAFHAAQNNGQFEHFSFAPNKPNSIKLAMPPANAELKLEDVMASMPDFRERATTCFLIHALTLPTDEPMSKVTALKDLLPNAHDELMADLDVMKSTIEERNDAIKSNDGITYGYFHPDVCNASVDI